MSKACTQRKHRPNAKARRHEPVAQRVTVSRHDKLRNQFVQRMKFAGHKTAEEFKAIVKKVRESA